MKKTILLLIAGILLIAGCVPSTLSVSPAVNLTPSFTPKPTRTLSPSRTPTSSLTPSLTSTPQPAMIAHKWKPAPILISYDGYDSHCDWVCPPRGLAFILYGDGTLVLKNTVVEGEGVRSQYLYRKLSQKEICSLLNTIDQVVFLDFIPESYSADTIYNASTWNLDVDIWRRKTVSLYGLGELVNRLKYSSEIPIDVSIPPSVLNISILLHNYPLDGFKVFSPRPLAVWIWKPSDSYRSKTWTVTNISLAELFQRAGSPVDELTDPITINGKDADDVYAMFNNSDYYGQVIEGDEAYQIYIRPILPFEQIVGETSIISPSTNQLGLAKNMECIPSDGIMAIPILESK